LIRQLVKIRGLAWVCEEVARDEDPDYVQRVLRVVITGHLDPERLAGRRLLDFGCGAAASTMILGRMLPRTEIVGVELHVEWLDVAAERARHHWLDKISFIPSPEPSRLPDGIGRFTAVNLSAVWEHMHPAERTTMLPRLWWLLNSGGT
jgi:trans-aconitate methyltransferase